MSMKRLYLLRHAKSSPSSDFNGDHERPLAPRGVAATERLTRYLHAHRARPNVVLCSSARRTRETLAGIAEGFEIEPEVTIEEDLYCASATLLMERVRGLENSVDAAMLIGHNPGIHELAVTLADPGARAELAAFPAGALVSLDLEATAWSSIDVGACTLADYVVPRELV